MTTGACDHNGSLNVKTEEDSAKEATLLLKSPTLKRPYFVIGQGIFLMF
jgi:hypothetical protein